MELKILLYLLVSMKKMGGEDKLWIMFMRRNGTVKDFQEISSSQGGFGGILELGSAFGKSFTTVGDLDGDGVIDIAVGSPTLGEDGLFRIEF